MITIGVTGGVGAGKSEILRHLAEHYNSRILMSDNAAKDLEKPGGPLYEPLVSLLESEESAAGSTEPLLMPDKEINKAEMARRIFADAGLLKKINELVHPAVNRYILDEIERERKAGEREFFVLESALLLENGYDKILDSMWYIYCDDQELSLGRVNYLLRAAIIPAGEHTITMKFVPKSLRLDRWSYACLVIILLIVAGGLSWPVFRAKK